MKVYGSKYLPLVSVVTVTRNAISDLRVTLESVLSQKYPCVQFIVIDGGSTDGTVNFLESHHERIDYLTGMDNGIYDAMNKGLDRVRGEWMIFMNSGDLFADTDSIQVFVDSTAENVSLVYSDYLRPDASDPERLMRFSSKPIIGPGMIVRMICHQAILFNVANFPGYYDCNLRLCADLDVLLKIHTNKIGEFRYVAKPLVVYQGGGVSEKNYVNLHDERGCIIKRYFSWPVVLINWINHIRIRCLHEICT